MRQKVPERFFYDVFRGERCSQGEEREIEQFWHRLGSEERENQVMGIKKRDVV